jgi:capsular exopolysaccharide synthesis family protein
VVKEITEGPIQLRNLKVKRPPNSYLIDITYQASTPQLAAEVANDIAGTYVDYVGHLRAQDTAAMRETMMQQKAELEARLALEDREIAAASKDLNVLDPRDGTTVASNRLDQLTNAYTAAQSERSKKEAELEVVNSGSLAAAQISNQGEDLNKLLDRKNQLMQRLADVKTTYGENYPEYQKVTNLLAEVNREIETLHSNIAQRSAKAYQEAVQHEQGLKSVLDKAKEDLGGLTTRGVEYAKLKQQSEEDKKRYDNLVQRIRDSDIDLGYEKGVARMASPARPSSFASFPKTRLIMSAAFVLATVMGLGLIVIVDTVENRVSSAESAARHMSVNVMAKLPIIKGKMPLAELAAPDVNRSAKSLKSAQWFHENVRTLVNTLVLSIDFEKTRSLLVTSSAAGEGKSTVASHLALASAAMRRKTLLIDADMRRGVVNRLFDLDRLDQRDGLCSVLEGKTKWREAVVPVPGQPNLHVLPAGGSSQLAFDQHGMLMPAIVAEAGREYDLVLIDAPPPIVAESIQLARIADGVIVVAHADKTSASALASLISKLQSLEINIVGMVLNHARDGMFGGYYDSQYVYGGTPTPRSAKV